MITIKSKLLFCEIKERSIPMSMVEGLKKDYDTHPPSLDGG